MMKTLRQFKPFRFAGLLLATLVAMQGFASRAEAAKIVTFDTVLGSFDVELFDDVAPVTVANFLQYVTNGDYDNSFFHRRSTIPGVEVLQGGGFLYDPVDGVTPTNNFGEIPSEFNPAFPNVRGTIAMAQTAAGPDSATNQWFINLLDNSEQLTVFQEFTVFGQVLGNGMDIIDMLAGTNPAGGVTIVDAGGVFSDLPALNGGANIGTDNEINDLLIINSVTVVPEPSAVVLGGVMLAALVFYIRRQRTATART